MSSSDRSLLDAARCSRCAVRARAPCSFGETAGFSRLLDISHTRRMQANDAILGEGERAEIIGIVLVGIVRISKTLPDGRRPIVGFVHPGELFGQPYARTSKFSYEASTEVDLCVMESRNFERAVAASPAFQHELMLWALRDLEIAHEHSALLGCQTALERMATYLLMMLDRREDLLSGVLVPGHSRVVVSQVPRSDLAAYLNVSSETISRLLHLLAKASVIRLIDHHRFEVIDVTALRRMTGLGEDARNSSRTEPRMSELMAIA